MKRFPMNKALHGLSAFLLATGLGLSSATVYAGDVVVRDVEPQAPAAFEKGDMPFRITVDDQVVVESPGVSDPGTDIELSRADIQIHYDSLDQRRHLNLTPWADVAVRGEPVDFQMHSNYTHWIKRAEVRVYRDDRPTTRSPDLSFDLDAEGRGQWTPEKLDGDRIRYVLRVYDEEGHFDETSARELEIHAHREWIGDEDEAGDELKRGMDINHLALKNIPVYGGTITVNGENIPDGREVNVNGHSVQPDDEGTFVYRQIMLPGNYTMKVTVSGAEGQKGLAFERAIHIPDEEWFYVGLLDLTVGQYDASDENIAKAVTNDGDTYNSDGFMDGRAAFYVKGRMKGKYLLTAQVDTGEENLADLLQNIGDRDPSELLRQMDANDHYPVFGDDSTTRDDTPSQGKFYVRLEKGESHVLWGNFKTSFNGSELVKVERGLYGAELRWREGMTKYGDHQTEIDGFASEGGTRQSREEFRGTDGSLFFLRRREITVGSERITVEVRDKDSAIVISNKELNEGEDYDIDPLQGRIVLRDPLPSISYDGAIVRTGAISGNPVYLVVRYEYQPSTATLNDPSYGGRVSHWVTDWLKVGGTMAHQETSTGEHNMQGGDVTLRYSEGSYVHVEGARTFGPGEGELGSQDGGFVFYTPNQGTTPDVQADAQSYEANLDLQDVSDFKGDFRLYGKWRQAGFSSAGNLNLERTEQTGMAGRVELSEGTELRVSTDAVRVGNATDSRASEAQLTYQLDDHWNVAGGLRHDWRSLNATTRSGSITEQGHSTTASTQLRYDSGDGWNVYGYAQGTVQSDSSREADHRVGLGGDVEINDRITLGSEVSAGTAGHGAKASASYRIDDRSEYYMSYQMDSDRTDTGTGLSNQSLVTGSRNRFDNGVSVFSERRATSSKDNDSLVNAYGLKYAPNDRWTLGGNMQVGRVHGAIGDMDRTAAGASLGYKEDRKSVAVAGEYRRDASTTEVRDSYLLRTNIGYQADEDTRAIFRLGVASSDTSRGAAFGSDWIELVTGAAYRPVDNDEFNALLKYTYFEETPSPGQTGANGVAADYRQRSHIFSVDTLYDVNNEITVGGKYALRYGEFAPGRVSSQWFRNDAHLLVLRGDYHVVHNWDALAEYRIFHISDASDTRAGWLLGAYRHAGENMKIGIGYNFTDFSDDMTNLSYDASGWFFNVIGKF